MSEVTCPRCNIANPSNHFFCTECGANLRITDVEGRERQSLARELESVRWQLNGASRELDRLQVRISRLEGGPAIPTQPQPPVQDDQAPARPQPPASQPEAQPADIPRDRSPVSEGPAYRRPHGLLSPSSASVSRVANAGEALGGPSSGAAAGVPNSTGGISFGSSIDWEHVLGRNWFAIIGAVSLVLGLGFFLKLSFDNNWIGDTGRIVLGIAAGMALLGTGEYAQRRVPLWAQAVTAGGAAILYLSIYSAFALYQLIRPDVALLFLAVVVGLAGLLAIRYDSIVIGFLGIIGAFIAPVLLGPELLDIRLALPYILIVDLGILWVATFRNWRWFVLMGWIGSYGLFAAALDQFPGYEPILMQAGLTAMFLIFVGATTLFHILWRRVPGPLDMSIVAINGTAFFALTVAILWEDYQVWFGLISLSLSLLYGLIAYAALKRPGAPTEIAMIALPMALVFLTVAVPMQLSGVWLTTAWAAQGVGLVWTGFLLYKTSMRIFGLGALALAAGYLLLFGASVDLNSFVPVMNERFLIFVVVIIAFYAAGYLFWRNRDLDEEWEESMPPILLTVASGLTLGLLSMEAVDYFSSRYDGFVAQQSATNGTLLSLTAIWSTYAFLLMAVGLKWRLPLARWGGIGLAGAAMLKLLAFDTFVVRLDPLTSVSVLNSALPDLCDSVGAYGSNLLLVPQGKGALTRTGNYRLPDTADCHQCSRSLGDEPRRDTLFRQSACPDCRHGSRPERHQRHISHSNCSLVDIRFNPPGRRTEVALAPGANGRHGADGSRGAEAAAGRHVCSQTGSPHVRPCPQPTLPDLCVSACIADSRGLPLPQGESGLA